jgi:hypothetical protein
MTTRITRSVGRSTCQVTASRTPTPTASTPSNAAPSTPPVITPAVNNPMTAMNTRMGRTLASGPSPGSNGDRVFLLPRTEGLLGSAIPCERILGKGPSAVLLVCSFTVSDTGTPEFTALANRAITLLTAQPGCRHAILGHSADDPTRWTLTAEFTSVVAYRRAMSPFDVREHVIPFLSRGEASAYEIVTESTDGHLKHHTSLVAADASTVRPCEAAGPTTPRS